MKKLGLTSGLLILVILTLGVLLTGAFVTDHKKIFLPGTTSDGHILFEASCSSCHGGFEQIANEQCTECHASEMETDIHPTQVFLDPRWAEDLRRLDATACITCHQEHEVRPIGVTVEPTFCYPCHDDVTEKRESHRSFAAASCGNAGCHNYHDNDYLTTAFLEKAIDQPDLLADGALLDRPGRPIGAVPARAEYPSSVTPSPQLLADWSASDHATADVGCASCHQAGGNSFVLDPGDGVCASCHDFEQTGFFEGKHGVRTRVGLDPLRPADAALPMRAGHGEQPSSLGCSSCHQAHRVDTRRAAVEACLHCHADEHSLAFETSPHANTLRASGSGPPGAQEVTCASCHLPRVEARSEEGTRVAVHHNNSLTLRPIDSMAGMVCMQCHGYEFSLNSLMDPELVRSNFQGRPRGSLETFELIRRFQEGE